MYVPRVCGTLASINNANIRQYVLGIVGRLYDGSRNKKVLNETIESNRQNRFSNHEKIIQFHILTWTAIAMGISCSSWCQP